MRHWCKLALVFALAAFALALEVVAQTPEEQLVSVRALLRAGKNDAAIAKLEEIAAQHPGLPGVDHELGVAYYGKADYLSAIPHLQRAVEADKGDRDALQLLGLSYYLSGQPAQAIPYLQQFHSESSGGFDAAYVLAVCYALTKDYSQALNAISKLYNLPAGSVASRLIFARVLLAQGLDPVAEKQAREVLKKRATRRERTSSWGRCTCIVPTLNMRSASCGRNWRSIPLTRSRSRGSAMPTLALANWTKRRPLCNARSGWMRAAPNRMCCWRKSCCANETSCRVSGCCNARSPSIPATIRRIIYWPKLTGSSARPSSLPARCKSACASSSSKPDLIANR
jgi:tetratricopeptide (TPR) repeat protein